MHSAQRARPARTAARAKRTRAARGCVRLGVLGVAALSRRSARRRALLAVTARPASAYPPAPGHALRARMPSPNAAAARRAPQGAGPTQARTRALSVQQCVLNACMLRPPLLVLVLVLLVLVLVVAAAAFALSSQPTSPLLPFCPPTCLPFCNRADTDWVARPGLDAPTPVPLGATRGAARKTPPVPASARKAAMALRGVHLRCAPARARRAAMAVRVPQHLSVTARARQGSGAQRAQGYATRRRGVRLRRP